MIQNGGELRSDTGLNSRLLSVRMALSVQRLKILYPFPLILMFSARRQREDSAALQAVKNWEKEKAADTPRQSARKISHGSTIAPTPSWLICYSSLLHHCSHILLKPHYRWSMPLLQWGEKNDLLESNIFSAYFMPKSSGGSLSEGSLLLWQKITCNNWVIEARIAL